MSPKSYLYQEASLLRDHHNATPGRGDSSLGVLPRSQALVYSGARRLRNGFIPNFRRLGDAHGVAPHHHLDCPWRSYALGDEFARREVYTSPSGLDFDGDGVNRVVREVGLLRWDNFEVEG